MLAGSSISQKEAVEKVLEWGICSLADALEMASVQQSKIFNVPKHTQWNIGDAFSGILFEKENEILNIKETWLEGERVFNK